MKTFTKVVALAGVAAMLAPTLAFAKSDHANAGLEVRLKSQIERLEKGDHKDAKSSERWQKHASTTAAAIIKKSQRIEANVNTMLSFDARIQALLASSTVSNKAELQAKYNEFKTEANNAKVEARNAINVASQVNANNSTTTNASLVAQAKVDLREAGNWLKEAKEALFSVLHGLWK